MKFTLEIQCDNAAFEHEPAAEVARLLRTCAHKLEYGFVGEPVPLNRPPYKLRDVNGNTVGTYGFSDD